MSIIISSLPWRETVLMFIRGLLFLKSINLQLKGPIKKKPPAQGDSFFLYGNLLFRGLYSSVTPLMSLLVL